MKRVLITGVGGGGSNNLIRSIRQSKYPVEMIGSNADRYQLAHSLLDKNYLIPRGDAPTGYLEALQQITRREKLDLIIPNNDTEVRAISRLRADIGTPVLLPDHETIELCQDKFSLQNLLAEMGFRVAKTREIHALDGVDAVFGEFKGEERLWCRMRRGSGSRGSLPVNHPDQAKFWIKYWQEMRGVAGNMFLLSEYLPGRDYAFQSLWDRGKLVIAKTCQRVVYLFGENTPSGTSSTPRIGRLLNNPQVNDICTRAVRAIDPQANGLFSIDLKEDRNGIPCITEINIGRFFMITVIFNLVGRYNMAELYLKLALGEAFEVDEESRYGDIGSEETYLVRSVDNEPRIVTASQLAACQIDLC